MQFALTSKKLPATRYFVSYSAAREHAKALGFTSRQYKIIELEEKALPITNQEYQSLERALQWPEDLAQYDKNAKPTNLPEIGL